MKRDLILSAEEAHELRTIGEFLREFRISRPAEDCATLSATGSGILKILDEAVYFEGMDQEDVCEMDPEDRAPEATPAQRRARGDWHCPECFTFGHIHRKTCSRVT